MITLKFPELGGGTVQGLNDAGVENFQGAIDTFLSRECGQNTVDAARPDVQTVRLEFDRLTLRAEDIPAFPQLRTTLKACLERWKDKPKEMEVLTKAISAAAKDEINVLRIADYGTTGLTGTDTDESGRWLALVKSQGVSNKGATAGGSFGIGKSSPFAASQFRTVFYGTATEDGQSALQGVSRLMTHTSPDKKSTQGVGFIGKYDPRGGPNSEPLFLAVRNKLEIPEAFRRNEPGTDIWVLGYRSGSDWSQDLTRSILSNFWPAIYRGTIEFRVGQQKINRANLASLISQCKGMEDFEADKYFPAILNKPAIAKLDHVGDCELYLRADDPTLPRRICMVRKTGMRIFDYAPKACRVPFSGLFVCNDEVGNKLLRMLEPPKHDEWDPKRTDGSEGKKALEAIKKWIREEVKKLNPVFSGSSFNETELAKYMPDDEEDTLPDDASGKSKEQQLEPRPVPNDQVPKSLPVKPVSTAVAPATAVAEPSPPPYGGAEGGAKRVRGIGETDGPQPKPTKVEKAPRVAIRSYQITPSEYMLILRCPVRFSGSIRVFAIGEDGEQEAVEVREANVQGPKAIRLPLKQGAISGIQLKPGAPFPIVVKVNELDRRALTVEAQS